MHLRTPSPRRATALVVAAAAAFATSCAPEQDAPARQLPQAAFSATTPLLYATSGMFGVNDVIRESATEAGMMLLSLEVVAPGVVGVDYAVTAQHGFYPLGTGYLNLLPAASQSSQQRGSSTLMLYVIGVGGTVYGTMQLTAKLENGRTSVMVSSFSDTAVPGATVDPTWFVVGVPTRVSNVTTTGTVAVSQPLTGTYVYQGASNAAESGSTFQWYTVDAGVKTPIAGATGRTLTLPASVEDASVQFCVTPRNASGFGLEACAAAQRVPFQHPQLTWYAEPQRQGDATARNPTGSSNGQCQTFDPAGGLGPRSYALTGPATPATLIAYQTADCTSNYLQPSASKTAGADETVGYTFPASFVARSYRVRW